MKTFIALFLFLSIYVQQFFFGVSGLLGFEYLGMESNNTYIYYVFFVFFVTASLYIFYSFRLGVLKSEFYFLIFILFYFCVHVVWVLANGGDFFFTESFVLFWLLGAVGFFAGLLTYKLDLVPVLIRYNDPVSVLFSLCILFYSIIPLVNGIRQVEIGGATYQFFSYFSALTVGLILYSTYICNAKYRFYFFKSRLYFYFSHVLLCFSFIGTILGGGRGAFILMIFYFLIVIKNVFFYGIKRGFLYFRLSNKMIFIFSFILVSQFYFFELSFLQNGFERVFSFIGSNGINMAEGSSGRDVVYLNALSMIIESPYFGYGPFSGVRPHNIFLEFFLQFGVFAGIILTMGLVFIIYKMLVVSNELYYFVSFTFLFPIVMLQFSGTYMWMSTFWFVLSYFSISRFYSSVCKISTKPY